MSALFPTMKNTPGNGSIEISKISFNLQQPGVYPDDNFRFNHPKEIGIITKLISEKIKKVALTLKKHRQPERRPENDDNQASSFV